MAVYIPNDITIHCASKKEATTLFKFLKTKGYTWQGGGPLDKTFWESYGDNTGYKLLDGKKVVFTNYKTAKWNAPANTHPMAFVEFYEFKEYCMEPNKVFIPAYALIDKINENESNQISKNEEEKLEETEELERE